MKPGGPVVVGTRTLGDRIPPTPSHPGGGGLRRSRQDALVFAEGLERNEAQEADHD